MTEREWMTGPDHRPMLEFLRGRAGERKLRLFACALCRCLWPGLFAHDKGWEESTLRRLTRAAKWDPTLQSEVKTMEKNRLLRHAVEAAERFADGAATREEMAAAHAAL